MPQEVPSPNLRDYITAHAKIILAIITVLASQFAADGGAQWVIDIAGLILIGAVPNNQAAIEMIYPSTRAKRLRDESGELGLERGLAIALIIIAVAVLLSVLL